MVAVWDADTGVPVIQFVARMRLLPDGTELPVAVTAMRFDGSLRRLVAGFADGCIRTFNFNNGAVLREVGSVFSYRERRRLRLHYALHRVRLSVCPVTAFT